MMNRPRTRRNGPASEVGGMLRNKPEDSIRLQIDAMIGAETECVSSHKIDDKAVCKMYLLECCPYGRFEGSKVKVQNMCKDIHDPILLSQYRQNPEKYMFEIDAYTELKRFLDDIDEEIKHKTLKNTNTEKYLQKQEQKSLDEIEDIEDSLKDTKEILNAAEEEGDMDKSTELNNKIAQLSATLSNLRSQLFNVRQQIKSEGRTIICQSCGGITSHEDSFDKRHIEHQRGKGHAAMEYLRNRFAEIKTKAIQQKDDWKEEKKISQSRSRSGSRSSRSRSRNSSYRSYDSSSRSSRSSYTRDSESRSRSRSRRRSRHNSSRRSNSRRRYDSHSFRRKYDESSSASSASSFESFRGKPKNPQSKNKPEVDEVRNMLEDNSPAMNGVDNSSIIAGLTDSSSEEEDLDKRGWREDAINADVKKIVDERNAKNIKDNSEDEEELGLNPRRKLSRGNKSKTLQSNETKNRAAKSSGYLKIGNDKLDKSKKSFKINITTSQNPDSADNNRPKQSLSDSKEHLEPEDSQKFVYSNFDAEHNSIHVDMNDVNDLIPDYTPLKNTLPVDIEPDESSFEKHSKILEKEKESGVSGHAKSNKSYLSDEEQAKSDATELKNQVQTKMLSFDMDDDQFSLKNDSKACESTPVKNTGSSAVCENNSTKFENNKAASEATILDQVDEMRVQPVEKSYFESVSNVSCTTKTIPSKCASNTADVVSERSSKKNTILHSLNTIPDGLVDTNSHKIHSNAPITDINHAPNYTDKEPLDPSLFTQITQDQSSVNYKSQTSLTKIHSPLNNLTSNGNDVVENVDTRLNAVQCEGRNDVYRSCPIDISNSISINGGVNTQTVIRFPNYGQVNIEIKFLDVIPKVSDSTLATASNHLSNGNTRALKRNIDENSRFVSNKASREN